MDEEYFPGGSAVPQQEDPVDQEIAIREIIRGLIPNEMI